VAAPPYRYGMAGEPTDVGPMYGGHLRVSDADRQHAVRLLDAAYADGRLTRQDHDDRRRAAISSVTFDDIVPLTRDLVAAADEVVAHRSQELAVPVPAPAPVVRTEGTPRPAMWQVGIFAGASRKGVWHVPSRINAIAMFGGVTIDLTEAVWTSDTIEVNAGALFGGIDIIVPDDVEVRDAAVAIFGGVDVTSRTPTGQRVLIVRGFAGFGGVSVKGPKKRRA
jgi:hypothetical protein